ncbi:MAG: GntR family transcriptional regulator [Anaerolineae bacterium]|nr:GntR family transcriptional regulator [Anaerolineae bacterium]
MGEKENVFHKIGSNQTIAERAYEELKELLESGQFSPGQKLPSEDKIASQLNISRITLRTALQKLELLGYVDRKRGVGTFVVGLKERHMDAGIERLVSISDVMRQRGHVPGTREIDISAQNADEIIARELQIKVGDPVTVISRVRTMDGTPLIYDHNIFPATVVPQDVTAKELGDSLFGYVLKDLNLNITHAVARLVPAMADDFLAKKLEINKGTLLIRLVQTHYMKENDAPIWQSTLSFPDSKFSWYIVRTR